MASGRYACIVLGAGAGTRFGAPKATAEVRPGITFLDAVIELAVHAEADPIVAVVQRGMAAPAPARTVTSPDPRAEQISSLRLGLAQLANCPAIAALVWPVDHPFVALDSVLALMDAHRRTEAPIVLPVYDGRRGHPALFARETWRELMTVADGGARTVVHAYGPRVHEVPVRDRGVLRDIDTPADLAAGGGS